MKKLILLLLISPLFAYAKHAKIGIYFKDGSFVKYVADSYWTQYNKHEDYYEYVGYGASSKDYVCISDYVMMNPVSRETKKGDYRIIEKYAKELGHTCHYFDWQAGDVDQYGISFLNEEIEKIEINI